MDDAKDLSVFKILEDAKAMPQRCELYRTLVKVLWGQGWTFAKIKFICTVVERAP